MTFLIVIFFLKVLTLIGATLNTIGFLTFFFWPSLQPYRWHMIFIGILLIVASEILSFFLTKRFKKEESI
jgi:hypothetical protein